MMMFEARQEVKKLCLVICVAPLSNEHVKHLCVGDKGYDELWICLHALRHDVAR